jgi:predicted  nucleic acid-binding Zn-ribbon protein
MGVFSATVSREMYDDMKRARDVWQQECSALRVEMSELMKDLVAVKRHELGLPPAGVSMADPMAKLGKKTKAAIEEMSRGTADQQSYLTNWALTEVMKLDEDEANDAEVDADLARRIYEGDPG